MSDDSGSMCFEDLLDEYDRNHKATTGAEAKIGDKVTGTLIAIGEEGAFVDLGGKVEGRLDSATLRDEQGEYRCQIGERIESVVTGKDEETGMLLLGQQHGQRFHGFDELEAAFRQGMPVEGQVTGAVKGGLEVRIAGIRGFCPASQVDTQFIEDLSTLVGKRLDFRVTKLSGGRRPDVVVSRRALLEERKRQQAEETRARLQEGAVFTGTVTSLQDYGAFVDIGGLEGMVHISQLAFGHVRHPSEVLQTGQQVEVSVLRIEPPSAERKREKIALSIRALARDPWLDVAERLQPGTRITGKVVRLQSFGAFVEIEPGIDGLVHISELATGRRVAHPSEVVQEGEHVEATVIAVDREQRRIGLTLDPERQIDGSGELAQYAPPAKGERSDRSESSPALGSFGQLLKESLDKQS